MAERSRAYPDNAPGPFFVDRSCIDCETCQLLAPTVFVGADGYSRVHQQPRDESERRAARRAVVACPTASIGTDDNAATAVASRAFPTTIEDEVSYCGYASSKSFGARSYFVERPAGNLLVDSPRAAGPLLAELERRGGIATMVLSHRDDVADHETIRRRFGCERVMHRADGIAGMERYVDGDTPIALADDLVVIPAPGHTPGSICLLYRGRFLFTGDHLWWNDERRLLCASRSVNWYSWPKQLRSLERLLELDFEWVLPGHGLPYHADSTAVMRRELERGLERLRRL